MSEKLTIEQMLEAMTPEQRARCIEQSIGLVTREMSDDAALGRALREGKIEIAYGPGNTLSGIVVGDYLVNSGGAIEKLREQYEDSKLDRALREIRDLGWMVAVHNDYFQNGHGMTFWLFTHRNGKWIRGEAETDVEALNNVLARLRGEEADNG